MNTLTNKKQKERGFSMMETLIAIAILTIAVAGPLTLASKSLQAAFSVKDEIVAFYLGVEGVEHVRQIRDSNILAQDPWLDGLDGLNGCTNVTGCTSDFDFDPIAGKVVITDCGGPCPPLKRDDSGTQIRYNYVPAAEDSKYTRTIKIVQSGDEADIVVTIDWITGSRSRSLDVVGTIFNWLP